LKSAFLEYGAISAEIKRRRNGESKGFGLVQFDNEEQAANALRELQGMELDGRDLELREDRPPRAVVQEA
jgi:RNA recognition motif-containing protein